MPILHKRIKTKPHTPGSLKCDHCGAWTAIDKVVRARWQSGWLKVGVVETYYEIDEQGEVDEITVKDKRSVPRLKMGWVCHTCQGDRSLMLLTEQTSNRLRLPETERFSTRPTLGKLLIK